MIDFLLSIEAWLFAGLIILIAILAAFVILLLIYFFYKFCRWVNCCICGKELLSFDNKTVDLVCEDCCKLGRG